MYIVGRPCSPLLKGSASPIKVIELLARSFYAPSEFIMKEIWKAIPDYPKYEVSNLGNARSVNPRKEYNPPVIKELKPYPSPSGYLTIHTTNKEQRKVFRLHRTILMAFIGPCPEGMCGCHNDGDKLNNKLDNLRWDTSKNNIADKKKHGTAMFGESHVGVKVKEHQVIEMRERFKKGERISSITKDYPIKHVTVYAIITRRLWRHVK